MDTERFQAGMIVDCLGSRLGTLRSVRGRDAAQVLEVQPDNGAPGGMPLAIPSSYVAQVLGNTVMLNVSCEEATRLGSGPAAGMVAGQAPPAPQVAGTAQTARIADLDAGQTLAVPVVEETLVPVKHWQEAGAVEVRKTVRTVTQELDVPVQYEEATVERVPVNRVLADDEAVAARQDGDTLVVPVVHEELVVLKRRVLVEELHITKQVRTTTRHIAEPVQREEIDITQQGLEAHAVDAGGS